MWKPDANREMARAEGYQAAIRDAIAAIENAPIPKRQKQELIQELRGYGRHMYSDALRPFLIR